MCTFLLKPSVCWCSEPASEVRGYPFIDLLQTLQGVSHGITVIHTACLAPHTCMTGKQLWAMPSAIRGNKNQWVRVRDHNSVNSRC